jgi:hypothetical protein
MSAVPGMAGQVRYSQASSLSRTCPTLSGAGRRITPRRDLRRQGRVRQNAGFRHPPGVYDGA